MVTIGALSYLAGALAQFFLTVLLTIRRPQSPRARWLILALALTGTWCALLALQEQLGLFSPPVLWTVELIDKCVWLAFLDKLLGENPGGPYPRRHIGTGATRAAIELLVLALAIYAWVAPYPEQSFPPSLPILSELVFGQVVLCVIGLVLVDHFFRHARPDQRWRIKFLCLALGGMFAYDLCLYTNALLFGRINPDLWSARGAVAGMIVPLISISVARSPEWNLDLYISRRIAFHSAILSAVGVYLLAMVTVGYYVRTFDGEWGPVIQIVFLAAASFALVSLVFSAHVRARLRVFLSKNFFNYAYDYREEWLTLIRTLSDARSGLSLEERIIFAIGRLVESQSGVLWVKEAAGDLSQRATYGSPPVEVAQLKIDDPMIAYMIRREWIVNLAELKTMPAAYDGLARPAWLSPESGAWLLLPLFRDESSLYAVLLLTESRAPIHYWDWEVRDFLKTAGRLSASYLALEDAGRQLTEAKQFEGFNRLSAFVIHDLKNLIAQLTLVVRNAERHQQNPDFVQDAFKTLDHVVERMNRLMNQLRNASPGAIPQEVDLLKVIKEVVAARRSELSEFVTEGLKSPVIVMANRDRLFSTFEHVVQNAQDAAGKYGRVTIRLEAQGEDRITIDVEDTGPGMSDEFIRTRLFRPFDTTKGITGMGIGAYESREYVRSLGGDVLVKSEPGKGTCFRIVIPRQMNSVHQGLRLKGQV